MDGGSLLGVLSSADLRPLLLERLPPLALWALRGSAKQPRGWVEAHLAASVTLLQPADPALAEFRSRPAALGGFARCCAGVEVLRWNDAAEADAASLRAALGLLSHRPCCLRTLDLSGSAGVDDELLGSIAASLPRGPGSGLVRCYFTRTLATDAGLAPLLGAALEELDVSLCSEVGDATLQRLATHSPDLSKLGLAGCTVSAAAIAAVAANGALEYLDLEGCESVDATALAALGQCWELETLDLENCGMRVDDTGLRSVLEGCSGLRYLNAGACDVTDAALLALAASNVELLELYVSETGVGERGLLALAADGCATAQSLRVLGLRDCVLVTDAALLELHRRCRSLRHIQADGCELLTTATVLDAEGRVVATAHGRLDPTERGDRPG